MIMRTDRELLQDYAATGSEAAFAELAGRHGPMVYRTCLRCLGDAHAAQDAAQAAFLVLARKARKLRSEGELAAWLHRVAKNTAHLALRSRARRARHEEAAAMVRKAVRTAGAEPGGGEAMRRLDRELDALPAAQRQAVVLRYLEGRTQEEAARLAGCPQGTLTRRATIGLEKLRERMCQRGCVLGASALVGLLGAEAGAAAPASLLPSILAVPKLAAAGAAAGAAGSTAAVLAEGVVKMMFWAKVKIAAAVGTFVIVLGAGIPLGVKAVAGVGPGIDAGAKGEEVQPTYSYAGELLARLELSAAQEKAVRQLRTKYRKTLPTWDAQQWEHAEVASKTLSGGQCAEFGAVLELLRAHELRRTEFGKAKKTLWEKARTRLDRAIATVPPRPHANDAVWERTEAALSAAQKGVLKRWLAAKRGARPLMRVSEKQEFIRGLLTGRQKERLVSGLAIKKEYTGKLKALNKEGEKHSGKAAKAIGDKLGIPPPRGDSELEWSPFHLLGRMRFSAKQHAKLYEAVSEVRSRHQERLVRCWMQFHKEVRDKVLNAGQRKEFDKGLRILPPYAKKLSRLRREKALVNAELRRQIISRWGMLPFTSRVELVGKKTAERFGYVHLDNKELLFRLLDLGSAQKALHRNLKRKVLSGGLKQEAYFEQMRRTLSEEQRGKYDGCKEVVAGCDRNLAAIDLAEDAVRKDMKRELDAALGPRRGLPAKPPTKPTQPQPEIF